MHMARTEGMRGMMKGNWTNCVRIIPNSAMKFFTYEQLSRWAHYQHCAGSAVHASAADNKGCVSVRGLGSTQQQTPVAKPQCRQRRFADAVYGVLRAAALFFFLRCRHCCRLISDHQLETTGSPQLTPVLRLLAGAGAGIVAMSATYPLDMVRGGG